MCTPATRGTHSTGIVPGEVEEELDFDLAGGIAGLRELVAVVRDRRIGIVLHGNVGMTSHIAADRNLPGRLSYLLFRRYVHVRSDAHMPRMNKNMVYLGACLIAGIRMARERQVDVRVRPTREAIEESVDLAHEIYNRVFRGVPEKLKEG